MSLSIRSLALAALVLAPNAAADLSLYSQDFEGLDPNSGSALSGDDWVVFGNVFTQSGTFAYGYGTFPAPNGGPGFSSLASGLGGAAQGAQYLNAYNDYNNIDHANGFLIEANVFQEQLVGAADVGLTWTFEFDYLKNPVVTNGDGNSTTLAFIKIIKISDGSFAQLAFETLNTTTASTTNWATGAIDLLIDPTFAGELLQFGFSSTATNYEDTGRFYDNISFTAPGVAPPGMEAYSQDFESLIFGNPNVLAQDGWLIFANVFAPGLSFLYNYGVFDAPNGGNGFSAIGTGNGGPLQGLQYLDVFSDYNNVDHANGNIINAIVFQEQPIAPQDAGTTWTFSFDHLRNPLVNNGQGGTQTRAFIKVIRVSDNSFATLFTDTFDTTNSSTTNWGSASLTVSIPQAFVGEVVQFGFESFATNYDDSSRLYDNIVWSSGSIGTNYCSANANSTGATAAISASGSIVASANDFTLTASGVPNNQFGFFINANAAGFTPNIGQNGSGNLCLGGAIGRFNLPSQILSSGTTGRFSLALNLTLFPRPNTVVSVMSGETWYFQGWYRDIVNFQQTSNLTNGLEVTFQ